MSVSHATKSAVPVVAATSSSPATAITPTLKKKAKSDDERKTQARVAVVPVCKKVAMTKTAAPCSSTVAPDTTHQFSDPSMAKYILLAQKRARTRPKKSKKTVETEHACEEYLSDVDQPCINVCCTGKHDSFMSQQYIPKYHETKVHEAAAASKICDIRAGKPLGWEFVEQYFAYEAWEAKDADFIIFHKVLSLYEMPEIHVTEFDIVAESQIPNGATVLEKVKIIPVPPTPPVSTQKTAVVPTTATVTTPIDYIFLPGVQYVKISKTHTVGPIAAKARFEKLSMHKASREGLLGRGAGKTAYGVSLYTDGSQQVPRLTGDYKLK